MEDVVVGGEETGCEEPDAALDETAVADATLTTEGDEYVNPLIVEASEGEEASIEEAIDDVLAKMLDVVELDAAATVSAATTDGSLLAVEFDADDAPIASAAAAPTLEA